jgi:serine/threonine-protein kinase
MGTAYYISPEQASGQSVTPSSDVYSLGIVAYECLTGRRPFPGDTPVSVALAQVSQEPPALPDDVPAPVRDLVMRMLAKKPEERPTSAGGLGREALALRAAVTAGGAAAAPARTRTMAAVDMPGPDTPPPPSGETTVVVTRRDSDTDPGFRLPDVSRLPHWLPYVVALAVLGIVVALLAKSCASGDPTTSTTSGGGTSSSAAAPTAPSTVDVAARDYLGRPAAGVRAELVSLGLHARVDRTEGGGVVGTVKKVSPTGTVDAGTLITLDVVAAPPAPPSQGKHDESKPGKGHGPKKGH